MKLFMPRMNDFNKYINIYAHPIYFFGKQKIIHDPTLCNKTMKNYK